MPIYASKCAECSHELDVIRKVSDPPLIDCPSCGRPALVKQITAAGFQLKGAGWYVTDFRDGGKKKEAGKPDEKAKADQASDSGTDAKAGDKADTKTDGAAANSKVAATTDAKAESKSEPSKPAPAAPTPPKSGSSGTS